MVDDYGLTPTLPYQNESAKKTRYSVRVLDSIRDALVCLFGLKQQKKPYWITGHSLFASERDRAVEVGIRLLFVIHDVKTR